MRPDLLVMGTQGRTGLLKALLGSVTEEALRRLDVDILVVPPVRSTPAISHALTSNCGSPRAGYVSALTSEMVWVLSNLSRNRAARTRRSE